MRSSIIYPITYDRDARRSKKPYRWDFVFSDWQEVTKWEYDDFGRLLDAIDERAFEAEGLYQKQ